MPTILPLVTDGPARPRRPRRSLAPQKRGPGRPARPWLKPRIVVPHPVHPQSLAAHVPQDQAAAWLGLSRTTAARWAQDGPPAGAAGVLLALYAHGLALPPEAWQEPTGRQWARFRFLRDRTRPGAPWALVTPCSGDALLWTAVDDAGGSARRFARLCAALEQWKGRALAAESEAARWRDLVACAA